MFNWPGDTKKIGAATPFTVAATPAIEMGSGTLPALSVEGASCEPNTERIIPGANACLKDAPFDTPEIVGVPFDEVADFTFTVIEAVALLEALSTYTAVIAADPTGNCEPFTASVALANPADPTSVAEPSGAPLD